MACLLLTPFTLQRLDQNEHIMFPYAKHDMLNKYTKSCIAHEISQGHMPVSIELWYSSIVDARDQSIAHHPCSYSPVITGEYGDANYWDILSKIAKKLSTLFVYIDNGLSMHMRKVIEIIEEYNPNAILIFKRMLDFEQVMYIMVSGKRCCGKDTVAEFINKYSNVRSTNLIRGFGHYMKKAFAIGNDLDLDRLINDYEYKDNYRAELTQYVHDTFESKGLLWCVKDLMSDCNKLKDTMVIIPDCRFKREVEKMSSSNKIIHINVTAIENTRKDGYIMRN
jgi:phosphomevalonate kinase